MAWVLLLVAGLLEIVWVVALKQADGFTRLWPSVLGIGAAATSFGLLALALKTLPVGTAYAVWVGIGAVGVVIFGIAFLGEHLAFPRMACLALIIMGVAGLKAMEA